MVNFSLLQMSPAWLVTGIIFILIISFYLVGHFVRIRRNKRDPELAKVDTGKMSTVLIGLLSFLLAFTFGMANSRYDKRRELTIEEANDISTAFLRTKVYPDSLRQHLTSAFKEYLEARIAFSTSEIDLSVIEQQYLTADSIGKKIWKIVAEFTNATKDKSLVTASQLVPALNAMIDITTTRRSAGESTIPDSIMYFLFALSFCSSFLLGYESKGKIDWIILVVFAVMISITIFTIMDLDKPRSGLIKIDVAVQKMVELRDVIH